jgi:hypothetical protein
MNHALGLVVLRGSVGMRHLKLNTMREEENASGGVIKLMSIIALEGGHKEEEVGDGGEGVGLLV